MSAIPPAEWPGDWRPHSTGRPRRRLVIAQKCRQAPVAGERHRVLQGNALPASFGGKTRAQGVSAEVPVDADELGPALDDEPDGLPAERTAVAALVNPPENGPRGQPRGGEPGGERRGGGAPTTGFTASALAPVPAGSVFECPRRWRYVWASILSSCSIKASATSERRRPPTRTAAALGRGRPSTRPCRWRAGRSADPG